MSLRRLGGPTVFSNVVPAFFDDDLDFGGGRRGFPIPRSFLRDAEKTFRQLDRLVNSAAGDMFVVSFRHPPNLVILSLRFDCLSLHSLLSY